ncbi:mannuronan 5-epimerase AlgG [Pseudomonas citronellolis]|uniref:mannuronan 5-epimerase AlgG n=1 Tax=Pseudomonas citronellolis TaxID=53408 RepID=UPI0023E428C1|nr:mannuronan 5-epimerase AlgG [Pseudomonas citronellolis]MDF3935373.1 mannuronan 5-epimerase AlgG [Pseudomonas citronellolis]
MHAHPRPALIACLLAAWLGGLAPGLRAQEHLELDQVPITPLNLAPPSLPDLSGYTAEAVQAKIRRSPAGRAVTARMLGEDSLNEFIGGKDRLREWVVRQHQMPMAIFVEGGYMTLAQLARSLPRSALAEVSPGTYLLRLPLVVRPGATLHIDKSVKELRLSQEAGAFLVNDGQLFVTGTRLTAWREKSGTPAWYDGHPETFRPYLIAWGGTHTYIVDSVVTSFGYSASKAYGVSISQYSPGMSPLMKRSRPSGWLLNSEFIDHWYGFYCYEADDVVVLGNTYRDNIVYGIDPHDRSRRLIIAGNETFGTRKKHGIIVSREVTDSWIIHNRSHDNHLSGIVVDRSSVNNLVAYNDVVRNQSDGITIYESPSTLIYGNRVLGNQRHGIRVRNSLNVRVYKNLVAGNRLLGIYAHTKDLTGTHRNLTLDPFDPRVSLQVVGDKLIGNGSGPISADSPRSLRLYNVDMLAPSKASGISLRGILGEDQPRLLDLLVRQKQAVLVRNQDDATDDTPNKARHP